MWHTDDDIHDDDDEDGININNDNNDSQFLVCIHNKICKKKVGIYYASF